MKKVLIISIIVPSLLMISCGGSKDDKEKNATVNYSEADVEVSLAEVKAWNDSLMTYSGNNVSEVAAKLYEKASDFANKFPQHAKTPAVLEVAAKASEAMGQPQQALNILSKLVNEFPETDETPKYLANMARIYETNLGDDDKARDMFETLIERFPNDPLAIEAESYMNNFLGKSDAEILMFLDSVQKSSGQ